jgi:signal transduction histidine kinase
MSFDASSSEGPAGGPTVLIAEDDGAAAEMLELLLSKAGYVVRIARDGRAALRGMEESPAPDIVLLDWMLPEVTGLTVCRRIRELRDPLSLPILMVTAKADAESKAAAFAAGANDYITKPFLGAELRARIAAHLRIKQLSEERRAFDEHLMEREKLSTLGLLVSGVAHDLNNPLGSIYGYAQLLLEEEVDVEKRSCLERILLDVRRCNRIVADLLSFARRHSPERAELEVGEILARTFELRERQMMLAGIDAELSLPPRLPPIVGDGHRLQQVFMNLLINAEHALRLSGKRIHVWGEARTGDPLHPDGWLAIHFSNDGPRIPEGVIKRIFEPFFTTKAAEEGTGLGLSICQRIVSEHGGNIEVQSVEGETTFTILLPVHRAQPDAERRPTPATSTTRA